ncbi:hypothetical protein [Aggregatilinea lenta]|uniref:hypothetical protein n=1 Tax=Aggregatilinea lenta TaxID=913108 RepID=UPI0013C2A9D6|nr:hypothetical protein [Aggregatilinea lenta]
MSHRHSYQWTMSLILLLSLVAGLMFFSSAAPIAAQGDDTPTPAPGIGDDAAPPPPSIGADIPLTYFGPAPSTVEKELIGPYQLLQSGTVDQAARTVTLPLYRGQLASGEPVWYILTDTDDEQNAAALGLNYSAKLSYSDVGNAVRPAHIETDGSVTFERGSVDFSPEWSLTPGDTPNPFPPSDFQPGSVGDAGYSPLAKIGSAIYNAPVIAFGVDADAISFCDGNPDYSLVHDKVTAICPEDGTVTLALTTGFSFARPVLYLSTEANDPLPATMERATYAPALLDLGVGRDDSAFSAVERLFAFVNGPTGADNPQRQGFNSALSGEGSPLNVFGGIPTVATDYSPLWDVNAGEWTQAAIDNGYRSRLTEEFAILGFVQQGWVTGPGGAPFGSTGLLVNCPVVMRLL